MNIFSAFTFCGGLAFFIFGMRVMSESIEKSAGTRLKNVIAVVTNSRLKGLALGAGVTAAVQSSSAVTVMLTGFVESGIMAPSQTVGVIIGSNIGTTITAWIFSLSGIEGDNSLVIFLNPENFSPLIAFFGVILFLFRKERLQNIGTAMLGFSVLMYGMVLMKNSTAPLAKAENLSLFLNRFNNPVLCIIIGALFTALIQSSSASVGVLQALCLTGAVSYRVAAFVIMGQNIGTCASALIASIGMSKNAKSVTAIHILFNIIGTVFFLIVFYSANIFFDFGFVNYTASPAGIALLHSIFNITAAIIFFSFSNVLSRIFVNKN